MVSPDYFGTLRIPLLLGPVFSASDTGSSLWVAMINQAMARRFWPDQDPIGQSIRIRSIREEAPREIVGIVADVQQGPLSSKPQEEFYALFSQQPPVYGDGFQNRLHRHLVVRTSAVPETLMAAVRGEVSSLDREQPVYSLRKMGEIVSASAAPWRFYVSLLGIFAGISVFLAGIGIYAVISYAVGERTHEIGIRMAIGAGRAQVVLLIFRQALQFTALGLAAGLAVSFALTRLIARFLFGVKPADPVTLAAATALLGAVACFAVWIPARRATRIDPAIALRHE